MSKINKILKDGLDKLESGDLTYNYFGCAYVVELVLKGNCDDCHCYLVVRHFLEGDLFQIESNETNPYYFKRDKIDELSEEFDILLRNFSDKVNDYMEGIYEKI